MLHTIAVISLSLGAVSALVILFDIIFGNRQQMMIMNFVYPITGLYAGLLALIFYYIIGRKGSLKDNKNNMGSHRAMHENKKPFWQSVAIGSLHCGGGCTLGDIFAEILLFFVPVTIFGSKLAGTWVTDYVFAFIIGIIFQYYSIKPMKNLSTTGALKAALKADTLSLSSWQLGMYGWMALVIFVICGHTLNHAGPVFWFMMQIAMLLGFITAYPVNWWLLKKGIKEAM